MNKSHAKESEAKDYSSTFQQDLEMMRYFQDEFMFRHKHYWNILIKFFSLTVIISILPIASQVFGIELNAIPHRYLLCFPSLGLLVSVISLIILLSEAKKMSSANDAKYCINKHCMDPKYHYKFYDEVIGTKNSNKKKMAILFNALVCIFYRNLNHFGDLHSNTIFVKPSLHNA